MSIKEKIREKVREQLRKKMEKYQSKYNKIHDKNPRDPRLPKIADKAFKQEWLLIKMSKKRHSRAAKYF